MNQSWNHQFKASRRSDLPYQQLKVDQQHTHVYKPWYKPYTHTCLVLILVWSAGGCLKTLVPTQDSFQIAAGVRLLAQQSCRVFEFQYESLPLSMVPDTKVWYHNILMIAMMLSPAKWEQ